MTEIEYFAFKEDIREAGGLRLPIIVFQNKIIDGRHRYRACVELGIEPLWTEYSGTKESIRQFIDSLNDKRRHLSQSERAAKAVEEYLPQYEAAAKERTGGRPRKGSLQIGEDMTTAKASEMVAAKIGVSRAYIEQAKQLQQKKPEVFEEVKRGNISIPEALRPMSHVGQNSGNDEYATPLDIIAAVHEVMGNIDIDPASSEAANKIVKAKKFHTIETDGLKQKWKGRVFINPPFSQPAVADFCNLLVEKYIAHEISEVIIVVNNATETIWFQNLLQVIDTICFPKGRLKFTDHSGEFKGGGPLQGQAVLYAGENFEKFATVFSRFGICCDVVR